MAATSALLQLVAVAAVSWVTTAAITPPSVSLRATPTPSQPQTHLQPSPSMMRNLIGVQLTKNASWLCPNAANITEISCTCDVPHTVRCRGQAVQAGSLLLLTDTLRAHGGVSLLDLAVHGLGGLAEGSFAGMQLLGLVITKAGLRTLLPNTFSGLESSLAALGLPNNRLVAVPAPALSPLHQLQLLDLSDNLLQELPPRAFPTLPQLHSLDLAGNSLRVLRPEVFAHLPHLASLVLARNQLDASQISSKTLQGLYSLQRLSLKSNRLSGALTPGFITGVPSLTSLDLSDNTISMVTRGCLSSCPALQELDLSHNTIDVIEDHAFANLTQLRRLRLSHNRVVAVSGWSLAHLPSLTHLALADNALRAVTADLLHQLPALTALDLAANDITLLQPHVFNTTRELQHLDLTDNPLHCDCKVWWLVVWLLHHPSLSPQERASAVCVTPSHLENAPLVELSMSQLVCVEESYHDYHDYYHDYYHDETVAEDSPGLRFSDASISLRAAHWVQRMVVPPGQASTEAQLGVELVWQVDEQAVPYSCDAVFVYQLVQGTAGPQEVLAMKVHANCSSSAVLNPHLVAVTVPGEALVPGATYRYCLILLERGTGDQEAFLPGCSEPLMLSGAPGSTQQQEWGHVTSVTAGGVGQALVVHARVDSAGPCTYTLAVVAGHRLAATRQLNCSEARHEFPALKAGQYVACVNPDHPGSTPDLAHLEHRLRAAQNVSAVLQQDFVLCTPAVSFVPHREPEAGGGPLLTLLFTLPGLALALTLYVIARRVWRGGGVPWRWDPRAQKSGKYFLYTGETTTPTVSLDPLPTADAPHTTTPV